MQQRFGPFIVVGILLLLGLLALIELRTPYAWALIPLVISSAWMLGGSKRLLVGYFLYASVAEYASQITRMGFLRFGDEMLLCLILVAVIFEHSLRRKVYPDLKGATTTFFLLIILLALSYLVNRGSMLRAGVTGLQYLRPFLLGYLAYTTVAPDDLPGAARLFTGVLIFQLLINLSWAFELPFIPHPGIYTGIDFAVGTMGSSLLVGYTACLGIVLSLAIVFELHRPGYLVVTALVFVSLILTNTAHAYAFLALMLIALALLPARRLLAQVITGFGALTVVALLFVLLQVMLPQVFSLDAYVRRGTDLLRGRKMDAYVQHFTQLHHDVPVFLLGAGPGNLGCAMADERMYLPAKYHSWKFQGPEMAEIASGSIIAHTHTGLLSIWGDMGPVSFLLYWGLHVYAIIRVTRAYRRGAYAHPWQRVFARSFVPCMVLYLLVAFMTDLVHSALWGMMPWAWAGTVWTPWTGEEAPAEESIVSRPWLVSPSQPQGEFGTARTS